MALLEEILLKDYKFKKDYEIDNGDLKIASGLEKVKEALFRRIVTVKGSLAFRPDYGVGIEEFRNAPATLQQRRKLAARISENLTRDPFVTKINYLEIQYTDETPESMTLIFSIKLLGYGEQQITFKPFGE